MSDTLTRPTLDEASPVRSPLWRNLYFTRSRGIFPSTTCNETEARCVHLSETWFAEREAYYRAGGRPEDPVLMPNGDWVPIGEFTFAIAVPCSGSSSDA